MKKYTIKKAIPEDKNQILELYKKVSQTLIDQNYQGLAFVNLLFQSRLDKVSIERKINMSKFYDNILTS